MVLRMRSRISSIAASGKRDKDGINAIASSTCVSVATRFIRAATSEMCNTISSPSSVSFRNVVKALERQKKKYWLGSQSPWICQSNYKYHIRNKNTDERFTHSCKLSNSSISSWFSFSGFIMELNLSTYFSVFR